MLCFIVVTQAQHLTDSSTLAITSPQLHESAGLKCFRVDLKSHFELICEQAKKMTNQTNDIVISARKKEKKSKYIDDINKPHELWKLLKAVVPPQNDFFY